MKQALKLLGATLLFVVICAGAFFGWFFSKLPKRGPDRISLSNNRIIGIYDGAAYVWIVRTEHGVALIDAGLDPAATAIIRELKAQELDESAVHTILITHGHPDHFAGAAAFPNAKIWMSADDEPLAKGERAPMAFAPKLFSKLVARKPPAHTERLMDGEAVRADGASFRVIATPGHTPGSMMFAYDEVLFTGDSLMGSKDGLALTPDVFQEDTAQNRASLAKLKSVGFRRVADGHTGVVEDAHTKLAAMLP